MFRGRNAVIATRHKKEQVIQPVLEQELGVTCFVPDSFDTDVLGTFSGEVERKDDPLTTARKKCHMAMEITNCDLAIASEGSFGPHPTIFFVPADDELLVFIDKKNNLEIIVRELSTATNFNGSTINTEQELRAFADAAQFPGHGLIARKSKDDYTKIEKGITDWERLSGIYHQFIQSHGSFYLETDMRAMYNPTRMNVIATAARKLTDKIKNCCPVCHTPGLGITEVKQGLPCAICSFPTRSTLSYIYTCQRCNYQTEEKFPKGKLTEDPMYCDVCNP